MARLAPAAPPATDDPGQVSLTPNMRAAPRVPRHRRPGMLALGVSLTCASGLITAALFSSASHQVPVLVAAQNIPIGTVITPADLRITGISAGAGIATIPARQEGQVTGRAAAVAIQAGTPLAASDLTSALEPQSGQDLVPVTLKTWQIPASGLPPGTPVLLVATPGAAGQAGSTQSAAGALPGPIPATVYQVTAPDQSGNVVTDLLMPQADAARAIRQDSTGQVALIVTPRKP